MPGRLFDTEVKVTFRRHDAGVRSCKVVRSVGNDRQVTRDARRREREGENSEAINNWVVKLPAGCAWVDAPFSQDSAHQTRLQESACDSRPDVLALSAAKSAINGLNHAEVVTLSIWKKLNTVEWCRR